MAGFLLACETSGTNYPGGIGRSGLGSRLVGVSSLGLGMALTPAVGMHLLSASLGTLLEPALLG